MSEWVPSNTLAEAVKFAGFLYDPAQDIIYSRMDATQRIMGYAYAYDDAAFLINSIIDCEPIFFECRGKSWMVELWKGQYGLMTGCEIGVYVRSPNDPVAYGLLDETIGQRKGDADPRHNRFFACAGDADRLRMEFTLYRNGAPFLRRGPEEHWWLTGFKWGVLSEPEDLWMDVTIHCGDDEMAKAFAGGLAALGYQYTHQESHRVRFEFHQPKTFQPRNDPERRSFYDAVRIANTQIVTQYASLNLPNNDPNGIPAELSDPIQKVFELFVTGFARQVFTEVANAFSKPVLDLMKVLFGDTGTAVGGYEGIPGGPGLEQCTGGGAVGGVQSNSAGTPRGDGPEGGYQGKSGDGNCRDTAGG